MPVFKLFGLSVLIALAAMAVGWVILPVILYGILRTLIIHPLDIPGYTLLIGVISFLATFILRFPQLNKRKVKE